MAEELLVGSNATPAATGIKDYIYGCRFQAINTANGVTKFYLHAATNGNVKIAVYADSSGNIGSRLGYNNSNQAVVSGWNELTVSSLNVSADSYYWLFANSDTDALIGRTSGGTGKYYLRYNDLVTWEDPIGFTFVNHSYTYGFYLLGETGGSLTPQINSISDTTLIDNQSNIILLGSNF